MKRIILFTVLLLIFSVSLAFAAYPVIFYSDLTSGPNAGGQNNKGVFVTISGKNFGAIQGSSRVTVGLSNSSSYNVDNYPIWSDTKITFQLGSNAATGNIAVTTSVGTSNGVPFTVRFGNIYFVSASSPNNPGSGTYADPWRSPESFYSVQSAGDTCYFSSGTYAGTYRSGTTNYNVNFDNSHGRGTNGNEIAWVAYPNATVTFDATSIGGNFVFGWGIDYYIVISGFICKSSSKESFGYYGNYIRTINNKCIGNSAFSYAIINPLGGHHLYIYGNEMTGAAAGNKLEHPLYIGYGSSYVDFGWNWIHDNDVAEGPAISNNTDGYGYQFTNNLIHDNIIDCRNSSNGLRAIGFVAQASGSNCEVYNNVIIQPGGAIYNEQSLYVCSGSVNFYNNTIYNAQGDSNGYCFLIYSSDGSHYPETVRIYNNIIYVNSSLGDYFSYPDEAHMVLLDIQYNCYYGIGNGPTRDVHAVNADPKFVSTTDFHLQATSPCRDYGYDNSGIVQRDLDGITRPQGAGVDIGAYEYVVDSTPPAAVTDLGASGVTSTTVVLGWPAPGNDGNSGRAASYDIRYSTVTITDANWGSATQVTGAPTPLLAGTPQLFTVSGLSPSTRYYFALKTQDYAEPPNISGLSNIASATTSSVSSGGGGGGCYIATATFGTPMAKEEQILVKFRDKYLLTNKLGRVFIKFYYEISPPIAKYIEKREWAKRITRGILRPIIWLAKKAIKE